MTLKAFLRDPWKTTHLLYEDSVLHMRPAPEFATAEVLVASMYRASGFAGTSESEVPAKGRDFVKRTTKPNAQGRVGSPLSGDTWRAIIDGVLESPRQRNQSAKRSLQLSPVIPDVALYSGSARLAGNSWNPGQLVWRIFELGGHSADDSRIRWEELFEALSVSASDDIWARWLQVEFNRWRVEPDSWKLAQPAAGADLSHAEKSDLRYPARQCVRDISSIIEAKPFVTRRQWISLLDAVVRLGAASHTLWVCDVNAKLWSIVGDVIQGRPAPEADVIRRDVLSLVTPFLKHGNPAAAIIRDYSSHYLAARLGLNLVLWTLDEQVKGVPRLDSSSSIARLLRRVEESRDQLRDVRVQLSALVEEHTRTIACKKGIGSNIVEFLRHTLGQRVTADERLRSYDQGYYLKKRGTDQGAPWVVALGPVAVLSMVHGCLRDAIGPRSIQRLCQHLETYGIDIDQNDLERSELGRVLRMLGLVLDSPDAESGMLLVPPFDGAAVRQGATS